MKRYLWYAMILPALAFPLPAEEPGLTKQQGDAILGELRQIRQILEKQAKWAQEAAVKQPGAKAGDAPSQKASVNLEGRYMLGSKTAPITLVEFTDYQCPFCQRFHMTTFGELKKKYIDTGMVRFYSSDLPLDFHANAFHAAEAARCAGDQGQFWRLRDILEANPSKLSASDITLYAKEAALDMPTFQSCLDLGKHKAAIEKDVKLATAAGINGTPTFIVGRSTENGVDGELLVGAMPLSAFEERFKALGAK
jgi:protein-disulfide isomerase